MKTSTTDFTDNTDKNTMTELQREIAVLRETDNLLHRRLVALEATRSCRVGRAASLGAMPVGELIEIDPRDQRGYLRAAQKLGHTITTAKTRDGKMVLIKLRTRKRLCPNCGHSLSH